MKIDNKRKPLSLFVSSFLLLLFLLSACSEDNIFQVDISSVPKEEVKIKRYEKEAFQIPSDSFLARVPELQKKYPVFFEGDIRDTLGLLQLRSFFLDPYMIDLFENVNSKFPDLNKIEQDLSKAFQYLAYYFPSLDRPTVYSYISGLDFKYPNKFIDGSLLLGLDMYLGKETKAYSLSGFPKYRNRWSEPELIVPDAMAEVASGLLEPLGQDASLLEHMIYRGKILYFVHAMVPDIADTLLFKYPKAKFDWVNRNQGNVWAYIIENQLLYSSEKRIMRKFTEDGPFTDLFTKKSAPRLADFVGYQIVYHFIKETEYSLAELMREDQAQKVLKLSRYKPKL